VTVLLVSISGCQRWQCGQWRRPPAAKAWTCCIDRIVTCLYDRAGPSGDARVDSADEFIREVAPQTVRGHSPHSTHTGFVALCSGDRGSSLPKGLTISIPTAHLALSDHVFALLSTGSVSGQPSKLSLKTFGPRWRPRRMNQPSVSRYCNKLLGIFSRSPLAAHFAWIRPLIDVRWCLLSSYS